MSCLILSYFVSFFSSAFFFHFFGCGIILGFYIKEDEYKEQETPKLDLTDEPWELT